MKEANNIILKHTLQFTDVYLTDEPGCSLFSISKKGMFPFLVPKDFSIIINGMLVGDTCPLQRNQLDKQNATICFINHNPQIINFKIGGKCIDSYAEFSKEYLKKFFLDCIAKCTFMVIGFRDRRIDYIKCTVMFYEDDPNTISGSSDIYMYSMRDDYFGPNIFQNYILNN